MAEAHVEEAPSHTVGRELRGEASSRLDTMTWTPNREPRPSSTKRVGHDQRGDLERQGRSTIPIQGESLRGLDPSGLSSDSLAGARILDLAAFGAGDA